MSYFGLQATKRTKTESYMTFNDTNSRIKQDK